MEAKVTVLTINGRREKVMVTPNTTLLQVLERVCKKHGLESDEYCLMHHSREVGLSQMFRFSGLPNNCLLEMAHAEQRRVESKVNICIQLENGSRLQGEFMPSDNLWHVITCLCSDTIATYTSPVAIYMREEIIGQDKLMKTDLKSLGITAGRAIFRIINRKPEDLKVQANVSFVVRQNKNESESKPERPSTSQTGGGVSGPFALSRDMIKMIKGKEKNTALERGKEDSGGEEKKDAMKTKKERNDTEATWKTPTYNWDEGHGRSLLNSSPAKNDDEVMMEEEDTELQINIIGERSAILFSLDAMGNEIEDLPDSFYDLTVNDLKLILRDLQQISAGHEDIPLINSKLREAEENQRRMKRMARYKHCVLRIQFPDRFVLQGQFAITESIAEVSGFVQKFLVDPNIQFELYTTLPKYILPLDKSLLDLNFVPMALIHFGLKDNKATEANQECVKKFLKAELYNQLSSAKGAAQVARKIRSANVSIEADVSTTSASTNNQPKHPTTSTGAIPKRPRSEHPESKS